MDETPTPSSSDNSRLLALFVFSITGLLLALGIDELPFASGHGPLPTFVEVVYFATLGLLLYAVGRTGATVAEAQAG